MLLLLQGLAPDQHVINVDKALLKALQHLVHEALETLARIPQPKWHADEFPQPKRSDDGCLVHVTWVDRYLVEAFAEIQLGEDDTSSSLAVRSAILGHV